MVRSGSQRTIGAALAAIVAIGGVSLLSLGAEPAILPYVLLLSAGGVLVIAFAWRGDRIRPASVLAVAALLHIIALLGIPAFEDDFYRFIWDGWRTLSAGTPYGAAPAEFFVDPSVPDALVGVLDGVNYPELPTIYGPVLQSVFAAIFHFAKTDPIGLRVVFAVANLGLIALMLRHFPANRVALYAWNPLIVAEITLHAHPDGLMAGALFGAVVYLKNRPLLAGVLFGLAAGIKIVALLAWPLLLRTRPIALLAALTTLLTLYGVFYLQGSGIGFETTAIFARDWHFNPFAYAAALWLLPADIARLACAAIAAIAIAWLHTQAERDRYQTLATQFGVLLLFASAVNPWYIIWVLPFAIMGRQIWPFAATAALPLSYLTGLNLNSESIAPFDVIWPARLAEIAILGGAIAWDAVRVRRKHKAPAPTVLANPMLTPKVAVIIPALNEEKAVGGVVKGLWDAQVPGLENIMVVDNGSTDKTAHAAKQAGAMVVTERERGYGAACLTGLLWLPDDINIVLFTDADGADVPEDAVELVNIVASGKAELAIGSRTAGTLEPGSMTWPQRFGNWLAPALIQMVWRQKFTDLGPLRAVRRSSLNTLQMQDRDFGWTVEMQVRAAKQGMACSEVPVRYRKRIGVSKISGTIGGVFRAGAKILYVVGREAFGNFSR